MTRDELTKLIDEAVNKLDDEADCPDRDSGPVLRTVRDMLKSVREMALQLDSPPAMTWQAEPSQLPMDAHVEGIGVAKVHCDDYGEIVFSTAPVDGEWHDCVPLNGRRVCPIPAPPALPKRGDA